MASPRRTPKTDTPLRPLQVHLPDYLVAEVRRAALVRSRIERKHVSQDLVVERALREHLWLDTDEMRVGAILRPTPPIPAAPVTVALPDSSPTVQPSRFGELLRFLRRGKNLAVELLATAIGMSTHHLYEVERGIRTPLTEVQIRQVAKIMGVAPEPLLAAAQQ